MWAGSDRWAGRCLPAPSSLSRTSSWPGAAADCSVGGRAGLWCVVGDCWVGLAAGCTLVSLLVLWLGPSIWRRRWFPVPIDSRRPRLPRLPHRQLYRDGVEFLVIGFVQEAVLYQEVELFMIEFVRDAGEGKQFWAAAVIKFGVFWEGQKPRFLVLGEKLSVRPILKGRVSERRGRPPSYVHPGLDLILVGLDGGDARRHHVKPQRDRVDVVEEAVKPLKTL